MASKAAMLALLRLAAAAAARESVRRCNERTARAAEHAPVGGCDCVARAASASCAALRTSSQRAEWRASNAGGSRTELTRAAAAGFGGGSCSASCPPSGPAAGFVPWRCFFSHAGQGIGRPALSSCTASERRHCQLPVEKALCVKNARRETPACFPSLPPLGLRGGSIGDEAEPTCRFAPLRESAVPRLHRGARRGWPRSSKRHFDPQPRTALGLEHSAGRCLELGHGGATAGTIGRAARCARARARGLLEVKLLLKHLGRYSDSM
jgi:hypothetical protein